MVNLTNDDGQATPSINNLKQDDDPFYDKLLEFNQFIEKISGSLDIFDPLDRDIPSSENNAIKRDKLLEELKVQDSIDAKILRAPLSSELRNSLLELIMNEQKTCVEIMEAYIADATTQGQAFGKIYKKDETVTGFLKNLDFFCENGFLENGSELQHTFKKFVEEAQIMIEVAKSLGTLDEESSIFAEARIEMHLLTIQRSYDAMAKKVV